MNASFLRAALSTTPRKLALAAALAAAISTVVALAASEESAPPPAAAAPTVSVAVVESRAVTLYDEFSGRVQAVERVEVQPRVTGAITGVHFQEGQLVRQGDLLFSLDDRAILAEVERARASLQTERARAELAQSQLRRAEQLVAIQAISQREYDERREAARAAQAIQAQAAAVLRAAEVDLGHTRIRAPIAGRVSRAEITRGNLVSPGGPALTTVVSVSPMYVEFDMDERNFLEHAGQGSRGNEGVDAIPVRMGLMNDNGFPRDGRITAIDNQLDARTGTIRMRAAFDNADGALTPGLLARLQVGNAAQREAVLIDERAVGTDQARRFVLVVDARNALHYREIHLGGHSGGLRVVEDGLRAGERIVVGGLQRVRPGAIVAPKPVPMSRTPQIATAGGGSSQALAAR
jgi:multidrug efflux system membrane fusion protein